MPPRKPKTAAAAGAAAAAAGPSRNYQLEETAVLQWLAVPENRNIVTGAAGAAQNGGGLSSGKIVTSKDAGWSLLAAHLNETFRSTGMVFDKKQAANKFSYLEQKYHKAKIYQNSSAAGITELDRAKGVPCHCCLFCHRFVSHFPQASQAFLRS
jgi:hypothetical protein